MRSNAPAGEETVVSDSTSDLRSGSSDFVDRLVACTFAGIAWMRWDRRSPA